MAFTLYVTVATGDPWSAANNNTYNRDNVNALWPYTAAGQIPYSTSPTTLAALAKPSVNALLKNTSAGALQWLSTNLLPGRHTDSDLVEFNPDADYSGANVAGASLALAVPAGMTATILALAVLKCYSTFAGAGRETKCHLIIDGTSQSDNSQNGSASTPRNESLTLLGRKAACAAGNRTITVYADDDSGSATHVTGGVLLAAAFVEG